MQPAGLAPGQAVLLPYHKHWTEWPKQGQASRASTKHQVASLLAASGLTPLLLAAHGCRQPCAVKTAYLCFQQVKFLRIPVNNFK